MTREEALDIARRYSLEKEVEFSMEQDITPEEALEDLELLPPGSAY
jgi:hypothetical protein